eukprot:10208667-Lingulodinium_polyedra.AAC.1
MKEHRRAACLRGGQCLAQPGVPHPRAVAQPGRGVGVELLARTVCVAGHRVLWWRVPIVWPGRVPGMQG